MEPVEKEKISWQMILKENFAKLFAGILASVSVFLLLPTFNPLVFFGSQELTNLFIAFLESAGGNLGLVILFLIISVFIVFLFVMGVAFMLSTIVVLVVALIARWIIVKLGVTLIRTRTQRWVVGISKLVGGAVGLFIFLLLSGYIFNIIGALFPLGLPSDFGSGIEAFGKFLNFLMINLTTWLLMLFSVAFIFIVIGIYVPAFIIDLAYFGIRKVQGIEVFQVPKTYKYERV